MRKPLVNYKAIKRQLLLARYESKRLFGHPFRLLFFLLLFFVFIFMGQLIFSKQESLPTVVLVDEDRSVEVRTFVENIAYNKLKNVAVFKETSLEEGLALLESRDCIGVIHIPVDTRKNLDSLKPSEMRLYIGDAEDIRVHFLRDYMEDMVDLLNEGQSGAMVYWREMTRQSIPYEEKITALEDIAFDYGLAFLTRGDVFASQGVEDPYEGMSMLQFYGYGLIWGILFLSGIFAHSTLISDEKSGRRRRLMTSGFTEGDYFGARLIVGTVFTCFGLGILQGLYSFFFSITLLPTSFVRLLILIWIVVLVNGLLIVVLRHYGHLGVVLLSGGLFMLMAYTSGLLIPDFYLPAWAKVLARWNLINYGDNMLKGYALGSWRFMNLPFYTLILYLFHRRFVRKAVSQ
jgi:hypothetical protein